MKNINHEKYFLHLNSISFMGKLYKKYFCANIFFIISKFFGPKMLEVGSGIGNGVLGAFPTSVTGIDINPISVDYCRNKGYKSFLIEGDGLFPVLDHSYDVCVLDNVLEHISNPALTLDECYRVTKMSGGLIISVPGVRGYNSDPDHKLMYEIDDLIKLDRRWTCIRCFSLPFLFTSNFISNKVKQYTVVAVYRKSI